jgi:phenylacetate-CoA ligase
LKLQSGIFGAEAWSETMRQQIEQSLGLKAFDIYGLAEILGPSVSQECEYQNGMHIWEDHFIPEILENGELVFTTLTKQGIPLIRYRTKDISSIDTSKCRCGRSHARMMKLSGRTDDMLIIRGVNVFPSQIESVLLTIDKTLPHYKIIVDRIGSLDTITVEVEISEEMFSDHIKGLEELSKLIYGKLQSILGISCKVKLVEPKSITRSEGKAKRVEDRRKL